MSLSVRFSNPGHAKRVIARAITCSILLILPACGIPLLRQAMPGPALQGSYTAGFKEAGGPENTALVPIEDFFNDPLLTRLICQAVTGGNQELRVLYEDVQIAQNEVLGRSGAYLPFFELGLVAGLDKFSRYTPLGAAESLLTYPGGHRFPEPEGNFLATANISWQVDIWRQLRNLRDAAKLRFLATNEGRNYVITRLVAEIAANYYMLLALDKRLENLDYIIRLQERSLEMARARMQFARGTELGIQRFLAEIRMNQSQKLLTRQAIVDVENRINFLVGRYPQPVERKSVDLMAFVDLSLHALSLGVPAQLLQNRPDIRQAERELAAAGLDVKAARARFFPRLDITGPEGPLGPYGPVGWQAFNPKYLFVTPDALLVNVAGNLVTPLINKRAIRADYKTANARQLQAVYRYQRVILNAYTEVVTRMSKVRYYGDSIELKKQQVNALETSVRLANDLFQAARTEYMDVLFAQRDLWDARLLMIETKQQQLAAIVDVYQALGGGLLGCGCTDPGLPQPGPSLAQSQQGGSNPSGTDQLPAPDKQPEQQSGPSLDQPQQRESGRSGAEQAPAPRKQPEQQSGYSLDQSQQEEGDPSGTEQVPSPRKLPGSDELPGRLSDPRKLPEPD